MQCWHGAADPAPGGCRRRTPPGSLTKPPAAGNRRRHALPRARLPGTLCRAAGGETPAHFRGAKYPSCASLGRLFVLLQSVMLRGSIPTRLLPGGREWAGAKPDPRGRGMDAGLPEAELAAVTPHGVRRGRGWQRAAQGEMQQRGAGAARLLPDHGQQERRERDLRSRSASRSLSAPLKPAGVSSTLLAEPGLILGLTSAASGTLRFPSYNSFTFLPLEVSSLG